MKATSEELAAFVSVVENGSFSRAAEQLDQANSVVSRTVKRLEEKLGVTLLNRTTRQISLTQEGQFYFKEVQRILEEMATAEDNLLEAQKQPQGLLTIDAATPVMHHLIAPHIVEFQTMYPKIILSLSTSENFVDLIARKIDVAIRVGELTDSTLRARKLLDSYRYCYASPAYLKKHGKPQTVEDLKRHLCIGFTNLPHLNQWPLVGQQGQPVTINPNVSSTSGETQLQLCLQGCGIACLSDFMTFEFVERGELIPLFENETRRIGMPIHAVFYSDNAVSIRLRCFIDFISERITPFPELNELPSTILD